LKVAIAKRYKKKYNIILKYRLYKRVVHFVMLCFRRLYSCT